MMADLLRNKYQMVTNFVNQQGATRQHIDSYNYFVNSQIPRFFQEQSMIIDRDVQIIYSSVEVKMPTEMNRNLYPQECRMKHASYSTNLSVTIQIRIKGLLEHNQTYTNFCTIPVMLRSQKCHLFNKSYSQQVEMGEDFYDPGGYYIINGTEKVLLIQEQTSNNRIIVTNEAKDAVKATITSQTQQISISNVWLKKNKIYFSNNRFKEDVNVFIIFKAMGYTSDVEIVNIICQNDPEIGEALEQTLYECSQLGIFTQFQALAYLYDKSRKKNQSVYEFLKQLLFNHIPTTSSGVSVVAKLCQQQTVSAVAESTMVKTEFEEKDKQVMQVSSEARDLKYELNDNFYPKVVYLAEVVKRVILTAQKKIKQTDKDFYGNKRLELDGDIFSIIFEQEFKTFNLKLRNHFNKGGKFDERLLNFGRSIDLSRVLSTGYINMPDIKFERNGLSQLVSRYCYISALGQMTRLNSAFNKDMKSTGPRMLNASQLGICCPSDTPEGETVGLTKNLSVLATVSVKVSQEVVERILFQLGVEDINFCNPNSGYKVFVNGVIIGVHNDLQFLLARLRKLRRSGKIDPMISVFFEPINKSVNINTDAGRCLRPLIIVENGFPKVKQNDIDDIQDQIISFTDLVKMGKIEYVDVNEELNCLIAFSELDLHYSHDYTHVEIDPISILGFVCALVPFPHHNQSPRNVFQCAMGKQALGIPALNFQNRFDSVLYQLTYPQKPLVSSVVTRYATHYMEMPAGQNAVVAVTSFSGYDIEDAIIMNRASIDRGYGRCTVYKTSETKLVNDKQIQDVLYANPVECDQQRKNRGKTPENYNDFQTPIEHNDQFKQTGEYFKNPDKYRLDGFYQKYHAIDIDGLPKLNAKVEDQDAIVFNSQNNQPTSGCLKMHLGLAQVAAIDTVLISKQQQETTVRVKYREHRLPYYGDKFSSRHGQKGTVGLIVNQTDMPFSPITGIVPDQIMNPHGFPSRMTIGKMLELLIGKTAVLNGQGADGTIFRQAKTEDICSALLANGFNYHGKDILISGLTGLPCKSYVFEGPIYYQRLRHMVNDKMHARSRGPVNFQTRQPLEGRSKDGGLRLGEMEKDCLIAYGASALLNERMVYSSDLYIAHICSNCQLIQMPGWCQICQSGSAICEVKLPFAVKLMSQELMAMGVVMKLKLD